jgi:hypothetical protein
MAPGRIRHEWSSVQPARGAVIWLLLKPPLAGEIGKRLSTAG